MRRRNVVALLVATLVLLSCSACSSVPPTAWQVAPLMHDDSSPIRFINHYLPPSDIAFFTNTIANDTAGGLWAESSGSWLHVDEQGRTAANFYEEQHAGVRAITALTPTVLAVSENTATDGTGTIYRFDTVKRTRTVLAKLNGQAGAITKDGRGGLVFVEFPGLSNADGSEHDYRIRAIDKSGRMTVVASSVQPASSVEIAAGRDGAVNVNTDRGSFLVRPDGALESIDPAAVRNPLIAMSPGGHIITRAALVAPTMEDVAVTGGSSDARQILTNPPCCGTDSPGPLTITRGSRTTTLAITAGAVAAVWLSESAFVYVQPGGGDAAVLTKVTLPQSG